MTIEMRFQAVARFCGRVLTEGDTQTTVRRGPVDSRDAASGIARHEGVWAPAPRTPQAWRPVTPVAVAPHRRGTTTATPPRRTGWTAGAARHEAKAVSPSTDTAIAPGIDAGDGTGADTRQCHRKKVDPPRDHDQTSSRPPQPAPVGTRSFAPRHRGSADAWLANLVQRCG
jgi:hypothetical protein